MKKLFYAIMIIAFSVLLSSCQKDNEQLLYQEQNSELKTDTTYTYKKIRNSIDKRAESERFCYNTYYMTDSVIVDGASWQYNSDVLYEGLTKHVDLNGDYFYLPLVLNNYTSCGIGFGNHNISISEYAFIADIEITIPEKNYTITYLQANCFAVGVQSLSEISKVKIVLKKKQANEPIALYDSIITFNVLKSHLGLQTIAPDSINYYSSIGTLEETNTATIYNSAFYGGSPDIYGFSGSTPLQAIQFGDAFNDGFGCYGLIDVYLHTASETFKCSTYYSTSYSSYTGSRKQLHIHI